MGGRLRMNQPGVCLVASFWPNGPTIRCREHICKVVKSGSPSHCQKQRPLPSQGLWYFVWFAEPSNFPVPGKNHEMIWSGIMVLDWCLLLSCVGNPVGNTTLSSLVFRWETTDYTGCPPLIIGTSHRGRRVRYACWAVCCLGVLPWTRRGARIDFLVSICCHPQKDRTANLPLWGFLLKRIFSVVRCPKIILLGITWWAHCIPLYLSFMGMGWNNLFWMFCKWWEDDSGGCKKLLGTGNGANMRHHCAGFP